MESRRTFLKASAAALTAAATEPLFGIQGANDRVRMAIIGTGNRGGRVFDSFARANVQWVAAAEVNKAKLETWMTPARQTFKLDVVGDYRRILDRKDVDAVLIATPDHWHAQQTVDAIAAGKDVYVEKPASNTIARINAMLQAYKKGKQVVQIGTQQRSWDHFQEAKKISTRASSATSRTSTSSSPGRTRGRKRPRRRCRRGWTGKDSRGRRRSARSSRAGWRSAAGMRTAAAWSPIGAPITSTSHTGS